MILYIYKLLVFNFNKCSTRITIKMINYKGIIKARIVEARFALSGKIANVNHYAGDVIKKWGIIASLDRKILQTELESELNDYEKVRADFEVFAQKNPNPTEEIEKYLKTQKQALLNMSVKDVEVAKAKLDMADLFSPVEGIVLDDSGLVPGLYITPASSVIKIIDTNSYYFEIEIDQKEIPHFRDSKEVTVKLEGIESDIKAKSLPVMSDGKKFLVNIPLTENKDLLIGINGQANF